MTNKEKLVEATISALQGKLTEGVKDVYEGLMEEFEDDFDDLIEAYKNCDGTLHGFIRELNSWGQSWLGTIRDNYDCNLNTAEAATNRIFKTIQKQLDK